MADSEDEGSYTCDQWSKAISLFACAQWRRTLTEQESRFSEEHAEANWIGFIIWLITDAGRGGKSDQL